MTTKSRRTAVFVLGTLDYQAARKGDALRPEQEQFLEGISETAGLDADVVFVSLDPKDAGRGKAKIGMRRIREERPRVLDEIGQARADLVICFGPVASACVFGQGNLPERDLLRQAHEIEGLPPVYVTYGLDTMGWKAGMGDWLERDVVAAARGYSEPQYGTHHVLRPGTTEWEAGPLDLAGAVPRMVGFDLETYPGLDPWAKNARIRMAILADRDDRAYIVLTDKQGRLPQWLVNIAADRHVKKAGSNIKFDYLWMRRFGYSLRNMWDTSTAEHVIDGENPKKDLKSLVFKYLPRLGDYSKGQRDLVRERGGWENVADEEMLSYAGGDGEGSFATAWAQDGILARDPDRRRAFGLMMSTYEVLADIEYNGMCVDMEEVNRLDVLYQDKLRELRQEITRVLGPINLNSPAQLAPALKKAVPNIKLTLREWKRVVGDDDDEDSVTRREVLEREKHKHPIIGKVLEYRKYRVRHSTFIVGVREKYATHGWSSGQRFIHPRYRTDVVETYRLSSQSPNGQNIPRKDTDDVELSIKRMFKSRFLGGSIMEVDLSQIEIRAAAELSQDAKMLEAINSGEDIHRAMAALMLNKPAAEVTDDERQSCKARTFLILYGGGANKLARDLRITRRKAQALIDDYFATFTGLADYIEHTKLRVKADLAVTTPFGFKRRFIRPDNWQSPDGYRIERQAFNTKVQSTAACITYIAMIYAHREFLRLDIKSRLMGQVHDSILTDVWPGEELVVAEIMHDAMVHAGERAGDVFDVDFNVPLSCDIEVGKTWGSVKPYHLVGR